MDLLIKNGTIVNGSESINADVAVKNGKITQIGTDIAPTDNAKVVDVTISSGVSAGQLASQLYDKGLIDDKTVFYFQVKLSDYKDKFKDGTYSLNTSMKPTDMMKVLSGVSDSSDDGK